MFFCLSGAIFVKKTSFREWKWTLKTDNVIVKNKFPLSHTLLDHRYDVKIVQNFAIKPLTCRLWFHFSFEHLTSFLWTVRVSTLKNDNFSSFFNLCIFFQSNPNYADQPVEVQVFSRSRMGGRKAPQGLVST